jgi:hypothetical protein
MTERPQEFSELVNFLPLIQFEAVLFHHLMGVANNQNGRLQFRFTSEHMKGGFPPSCNILNQTELLSPAENQSLQTTHLSEEIVLKMK